MKIKAIIVEDEPMARENLEQLLSLYCSNVEVIAKPISYDSAREIINSSVFDVLFLDINIWKKDGFDLLDDTSNKYFTTIFTTAYEQFALKSFKYNVSHYLLKPIAPEQLVESIRRVEKLFVIEQNQPRTNDLEEIKEILKKSINEKPKSKILISSRKNAVIVNTSDIIRIEADKSYCNVFIKEGKELLVSKNLKYFTDLLQHNSDFYRVHKSHLININYVKSIHRGESTLQMENSEVPIPINEDMKEKLFKSFDSNAILLD